MSVVLAAQVQVFAPAKPVLPLSMVVRCRQNRSLYVIDFVRKADTAFSIFVL